MDDIRPANLIEGDEEGEDRSFVEEAAEISQIVKRVADSEGKDAEAVYDRWKTIVSEMDASLLLQLMQFWSYASWIWAQDPSHDL